MSILSDIWNALKNIVRRAWQKIVSFFSDIVSFFQQRKNLLRDRNNLAVTIKQNLSSGNYAECANVIFNQEEGRIVDIDENAEVIPFENLDSEAVNRFQGKDMLVLS